jgi:hypothetical protein
MVSGIMVSSTVALLVEVPASGSNENATFPRGQLVDGDDGGDGTTSDDEVEVVDAAAAAAAGSWGSRRLEAIIVVVC